MSSRPAADVSAVPLRTTFQSEQLRAIRDKARSLVRRAGENEASLRALAAEAHVDVRLATEAVAAALDVAPGPPDRLQALLSTQLQRSQDAAETARQLSTRAREQHLAADLLLRHLDRSLSTPFDQRFRHHAVLVVDDYAQVRDFVAEVLQRAGFVVRTAANGLEGLLAAYEMRPSVIIMDIAMPVLDGIEATRLIKIAEATRQARVIAYTGNSTLDNDVVGELFAAVVHKPASPSVIVAAVQQLASA